MADQDSRLTRLASFLLDSSRTDFGDRERNLAEGSDAVRTASAVDVARSQSSGSSGAVHSSAEHDLSGVIASCLVNGQRAGSAK